jgi:hypothetical protein
VAAPHCRGAPSPRASLCRRATDEGLPAPPSLRWPRRHTLSRCAAAPVSLPSPSAAAPLCCQPCAPMPRSLAVDPCLRGSQVHQTLLLWLRIVAIPPPFFAHPVPHPRASALGSTSMAAPPFPTPRSLPSHATPTTPGLLTPLSRYSSTVRRRRSWHFLRYPTALGASGFAQFCRGRCACSSRRPPCPGYFCVLRSGHEPCSS